MSPRFKSRTNSNILKRDFRIYGQEKIKIERKLIWLARPLHRVQRPKHTQWVNRAITKTTAKFPKRRNKANGEVSYYGSGHIHVCTCTTNSFAHAHVHTPNIIITFYCPHLSYYQISFTTWPQLYSLLHLLFNATAPPTSSIRTSIYTYTSYTCTLPCSYQSKALPSLQTEHAEAKLKHMHACTTSDLYFPGLK
jgi:hypothetical protein